MNKPSEQPIFPPKPAPVDGVWNLPGGRDGMAGTPAAVLRAIDALENVPAHGKTALKEAIAANLDGTENNFIVVRMTAHRHQDGDSRHDIGNFDIKSSKKHI